MLGITVWHFIEGGLVTTVQCSAITLVFYLGPREPVTTSVSWRMTTWGLTVILLFVIVAIFRTRLHFSGIPISVWIDHIAFTLGALFIARDLARHWGGTDHAST